MKHYIIFLFFLSLSSCDVKPKEINYGQDHCTFCDMTVVDQTHAAEYVTKKGRSYPFDAIECLIMKIHEEKNQDKLAYILVTDYNNPGVLIDARNATYLISEEIQSPMGANLSAFASKEIAEKTAKQLGGKLYNWNQIKAEITK